MRTDINLLIFIQKHLQVFVYFASLALLSLCDLSSKACNTYVHCILNIGLFMFTSFVGALVTSIAWPSLQCKLF